MSRLTRLGSYSRIALALGLGAIATAGCTETTSPTELVTEGPPMIRQVIMTERIVTATGTSRNVQALAFGEHDDFDRVNNVVDDGEVFNGAVTVGSNIRVVMDELLIGNYLEEISCRDGSYQTVPEGATPDDIAACAVQADVLASTCVGPHAVCLGPDGPIGVLDEGSGSTNPPDGTADDTRMIDGAVRIVCGEIDVPLSQSGSFWQPSGNQQVPALGGFNAVGPAIILATTAGLPTNSDCHIAFDSSVVDKEHIQVCAPEGGLPENGCEAGDVSRVAWHTEPIRVVGSNPPNNSLAPLGAAGDARILVLFNTPMGETIGPDAFTLLEGGVERTDITAARDAMMPNNVIVTLPGGYVPSTEYMLTIETGLTDAFGIPIPAEQATTVTWTTAAAAL